MRRSWFGGIALITLLALDFGSAAASAQTRMTDKDVENTLKNMQEDAKQFRSGFNSAVGKSTIRNTDQEKQAKALVEQFQKQTEQTYDHFKKDKNAGPGLTALRSTGEQIDQVLTTAPMGSDVTERWSKVKTELSSLAAAYGVAEPATPVMPK